MTSSWDGTCTTIGFKEKTKYLCIENTTEGSNRLLFIVILPNSINFTFFLKQLEVLKLP